MLDAMLNHPAVKKALSAGEERMGKAVTQLLANERFMHGIQSLFASALTARETLENGVRRTLHAVNLPSSDDVDELRRKLEELEQMVEGIAARVGAAVAEPPAPPRDGQE